jgi:protein TonB
MNWRLLNSITVESWSNATNENRTELVFEFRNKSYGAYKLRKKYFRRLLIAFFITCFGTGILLSVPLLVYYLNKRDTDLKLKMEDAILLEEPPPIDKNAAPLPPVIPPPPVQQTIKFTPPKIVKDEEVVDLPPTQEETKDVQVSTQTQDGDKDIIDLPPDPGSNTEEDKVYSIVEENPSFPGGESKLMEYLSKIKYPVIAREEQISGWVVVSFIVDKTGKIKDAKVLKGIGGGCNEEALKKIMSMPDWIPGKQNGRNVMVRQVLRVNFTLN